MTKLSKNEINELIESQFTAPILLNGVQLPYNIRKHNEAFIYDISCAGYKDIQCCYKHESLFISFINYEPSPSGIYVSKNITSRKHIELQINFPNNYMVAQCSYVNGILTIVFKNSCCIYIERD